MEWCKLYATFATDPKIQPLSDRAFRAYVEAMCYATLHETDGATFASNKGTVELEAAGLMDRDASGRLVLHGWLNRQRSKADADAKRNAGRNAARIRWSNAEPNTELEVEVEGELEKTRSNTRTASSNNNPLQPTDRQMFFAERLDVTVAQVVKLNREYGTPAVLSAMEQMHGFPPEGAVENVYGYLRTVASFKKAGAA